MISFVELDKRIRKQYPRVLQAQVTGEAIFPLYIRADKKSDADFVQRNRQLEQLYAHSSHHHPSGYLIETATVHRRQHGTQDEPVAFYFDTLERYLGYMGKEESFRSFVLDVELIRSNFPALVEWLTHHTADILAYHGKWPALLQVVHYFLKNPRPGLFARELPLQGLGTKFVENHKAILYSLLNQLLPAESIDQTASGLSQFEKRFGLRMDLPRLRMRWLDNDLAGCYTGGLPDITVPVADLAARPWQVKQVLIVENKTNLLHTDVFLTLPDMAGTLAIFGSGRAASLLASIPWLATATLFYWGDIDAEGFEILDQLMSVFPHTRPLCMDMETLEEYRNEWVAGSSAIPKQLQYLPENLQEVYHRVAANNIRLEQEQVHPHWVREKWLRYL